MIKNCITSFFLSCSIVLTGFAQSHKKDKQLSIFSVGKTSVSAAEFVHLYKKNHPAGKPGEYTREKVDEYLDLFIKFKLKVEEALHRGLDTTSAFKKEFRTYSAELKKPYLPDNELMDSLVRLTYQRLKEEVRASHILISLKPDASPEDTLKAYQKIMEIRDRALNGEDFASLAFTYSEDPSAKRNKGDLGYFTALQMVFPFEQAAYTDSVGEVTMPVRTNFGYHLIKVTDRRPARGEVQVSHIMIRTSPGEDDRAAKETIFGVYDKLQKGMSWEDLCKEYSQDASSKNNGGKLRPFGVGAMASVPEFEEMAFNLKKPGDISDPFRTQYGWHVLRLESKIPLPSLEDMAASLREKVSRDQRSQISHKALQSKIKMDFGFTENLPVKNSIFECADSTLRQGKWKFDVDTIDTDEVLFTLKDEAHSLKDFVNYVQQHQRPVKLSPEKYLDQLYGEYVDEKLDLLLEEKIKAEHPEYGWLLKEYYEGILLFDIMEKEVWNKASADSTGQQKYYQAHLQDYMAKERADATLYSTSSEIAARQLKTLLEKGDSAQVHEFILTQKIRSETGAFEKTERTVFEKVNWAPGIFETASNGTQYIVLIKKILPPGQRTFNEARPALISDYQDYLEEQWIEKLKKQYPVKVYKKGKKYAYGQLVQNE